MNTDTAAPNVMLRILLIETSSSDPSDVTEIGRLEMAFDGVDARIGSPFAHRFAPDHPHCTDQDLADAVNAPDPVDVVVTFDLARALEIIPPATIGRARWIGIGGLLPQVAPSCPAGSPEAAVEWCGLMPVLEAMPGADTPMFRRLAALALITIHLHKEIGLERMIKFSSYRTRPIGPTPALEDDGAWSVMPESDLAWLADFAEDARLAGLVPNELLDPAVGARARLEIARRRGSAA